MPSYTVPAPSRIPLSVWAGVLTAALFGRKRIPAQDGQAIWGAIVPAVRLSGDENLPSKGPYVVVANHLNGPGIWVGLAAGLIAGVVGRRTLGAKIRGVGVAAYRDFKLFGWIPVPDGATRFLFRRFYAVYGIIRMPHIAEGAPARGMAVRRILAALNEGDVVILFPEGRNVSNFTMREIQPGVGDLLRLAARSGTPVVPAGVAPDRATFAVSVGTPLTIPRDARRSDVEATTGRAIATMLPEDLRGAYG